MKKILAFALVIILLMVMTGCGNYDAFDTTYTFDRAVIFMPNGETIEGRVKNWRDYENSDQIQVTIEGKTYLTHISNVVLIAE